MPPQTLIIAHRGASGYLPEHTLEAYALAHGQRADFIEPDLVLTRDGVLICSHDITLEEISNVRSVYPDRARPDGRWYIVDFTLDELKRLERHGRRGDTPRGYQIATFDEVVGLVKRLDERTGARTGLIPEMKHPAFHAAEGLSIAAAVAESLRRHALEGANDAMIIQSFEIESLRELRTHGVAARLLFLTGETVPDEAALAEIAALAQAIGPHRRVIEDGGRETGGRTFVERAQRAGLAVIPYTFGDEVEAMRRFSRHFGVDALFTDYPDRGRIGVQEAP